MRSRVIDIRRDPTRRAFVQIAAEHPRACLTGSQHLIIGDSLVRDLKVILVVGQTAVISFGQPSLAQMIKIMELQNDDRLGTLTLMMGTNDVSKKSRQP